MEEIIGVPSDIPVGVEISGNQIWFQASIPKLPDTTDGSTSLLAMRQSNERINRCPVLRVSAREFIANHVKILAKYGIRAPKDMIVVIVPNPKGYLHFRVRLDTLYPLRNERATPNLE